MDRPLRIYKKVARDGRFYYTIVAENGEGLATSQMHKSRSARDAAIKLFIDRGLDVVVVAE